MGNFSEKSVLRPARILGAFMAEQEARAFAGLYALDPDELIRRWRALADARGKLAPSYTAPKVAELPPEAIAHTVQVSAHPAFQAVYPNAQFKMVELGKLIAFQHWVDADVSEGIHGGNSALRPTDAEVLSACLPPDFFPPTKMQWQANGQSVMVSSFNNTLAVMGMQVNYQAGQVAFAIGGGANLMLVREHAGRLVLANGYHRAWWLRQRGVEMVPVVMMSVPREGLGQPGAIATDILLGDRPPLIDDFLDDALATTFEVRSMVRVVKITSEVLTIPRAI